jgi:hypothetical protein
MSIKLSSNISLLVEDRIQRSGSFKLLILWVKDGAQILHSKEDWIWFSIPESCSMEWPSGGHILVIFQLRSFHFQSRRNRLIRLTGDTADSGTDSLTRTFFSPPRPVDVNCRRPLTSHPSPTSSDGHVNKKNGFFFFFLAESIITKLLIDY